MGIYLWNIQVGLVPIALHQVILGTCVPITKIPYFYLFSEQHGACYAAICPWWDVFHASQGDFMQGMMKIWKLQEDHSAGQIFIEVLPLPLFLPKKSSRVSTNKSDRGINLLFPPCCVHLPCTVNT